MINMKYKTERYIALKTTHKGNFRTDGICYTIDQIILLLPMFVPNERVNFVDNDLLNSERGTWDEHRQYKQS